MNRSAPIRFASDGSRRYIATCVLALIHCNHRAMMNIRILRTQISRSDLQRLADDLFGDFVKAVVDVRREVMAIGGELHADEEAALLQDGSRQEDLWGINIYPALSGEGMIEFDSMINIRPRQGNRSRSVEDPQQRKLILDLINRLVEG